MNWHGCDHCSWTLPAANDTGAMPITAFSNSGSLGAHDATTNRYGENEVIALSLITLERRQVLLVILSCALAARVAAALFLSNTVSGLSGAHDEITYSMLGQRFATGYGMTFPIDWYPWIKANTPQSYFSYTMSLLLAAIYRIFGYYPLVARLIMGLLSVLSVWLLYLVARRLFTERIALLASAIAAGYPYLIFYGVTLVTETPFTLALLMAVYMALQIQADTHFRVVPWLYLSVSLALMVLLRMAAIFFVPVLLLWLWRTMQQPRRLYTLSIPLLVIMVAIAPLTLRNYWLWGQFNLSEAQFGHVFWNGNHPEQQWDFHPYRFFPIPPAVLASHNDVVITNQLLQLGVQNVLHEPLRFVFVSLARLRELFTFWPTADSGRLANLLRLASFGWLAPLAAWGVVANLPRWRALAPLYLFLLIHTGIYAMTWTMIRYRMPMEPFLIMFGAYTLAVIYDRLRGRC